MSADGLAGSRTGLWTSVLGLFARSSTLVCCALPALLVALGAGAALSSLVSVFPQVVWLSEHKLGLVVFAGGAMAASGTMQWRNRSAPCPADRRLRDACLKTRRASWRVFGFSLVVYAVGGWFAFVQPWLSGAAAD